MYIWSVSSNTRTCRTTQAKQSKAKQSASCFGCLDLLWQMTLWLWCCCTGVSISYWECGGHGDFIVTISARLLVSCQCSRHPQSSSLYVYTFPGKEDHLPSVHQFPTVSGSIDTQIPRSTGQWRHGDPCGDWLHSRGNSTIIAAFQQNTRENTAQLTSCWRDIWLKFSDHRFCSVLSDTAYMRGTEIPTARYFFEHHFRTCGQKNVEFAWFLHFKC
jgi:hypothetical protein